MSLSPSLACLSSPCCDRTRGYLGRDRGTVECCCWRVGGGRGGGRPALAGLSSWSSASAGILGRSGRCAVRRLGQRPDTAGAGNEKQVNPKGVPEPTSSPALLSLLTTRSAMSFLSISSFPPHNETLTSWWQQSPCRSHCASLLLALYCAGDAWDKPSTN